jgi:hypothetical protein
MDNENSEINSAAKRIIESSERSEMPDYGMFSETLYPFAHSALEKQIHDAITEKGLDPRTYDTWKDINYLGMPAATPEGTSLVMGAIEKEIEAGNIAPLTVPLGVSSQETGKDRWRLPEERLSYQEPTEVVFATEPAVSRLSRVNSDFTNEILIDTSTKEIVGYVVSLDKDGDGFALAGSDTLQLTSRETGERVDAEQLIALEEARRSKMGEEPLFS